jgi:uncharacterized protein YwgA
MRNGGFKKEGALVMMDLNKRIGIISEIVTKNPGIGKTAMMKYLYLLQKVYKIPLGYDYSIYTYGPYASAVMEDIDAADNMDAIDVERKIYDSGISAYCITPAEKADEIIAEENATVNEHKASIQDMLSLFRDKNAKELELLTTIIYIYSNYKTYNRSMDGVPNNVHEIKPYFDIQTIRAEYEKLNSWGILEKAVN